MMRDKKVLLIGLEPKFVDYANLPMRLDEPTLRAGLEASVHNCATSDTTLTGG